MSTIISTRGLTKTYRRVHALDGLDLEVDAGRSVPTPAEACTAPRNSACSRRSSSTRRRKAGRTRRAIASNSPVYARLAGYIDEIGAAHTDDHAARARADEMAEFFRFMARRMPELVDEWEALRAERRLN